MRLEHLSHSPRVGRRRIRRGRADAHRGNPGTGGRIGSGGATSTGGIAGTGGLLGTGGATSTGGVAGTGGLLGTGGAPRTGGSAGTGGLIGTGGAPRTGGSAGTGGLIGTGGAPRSGGRTGTGGRLGTGGTVGAGGGTSTGGQGGTCSNVIACGGNVVGTWNVASSCLILSGDMDVTLLGLGCPTVPVTGALNVTGTWTARANGTYEDNTTTTGSMTFPLDASCLTITSVRVECSSIGVVFTALGWTASTCAIDAAGQCQCKVTAKQGGGMGVVSPWASNSGIYKTSGNVLTVDDEAEYTYCVSGNTLSITPRSTILPVTGRIVLQKTASTATGGASGAGGARSGGSTGAGGAI